jgi:peptide/nickel transport system substrate-binding protein
MAPHQKLVYATGRMSIRALIFVPFAAACLLTASCRNPDTGPVIVSAIGGAPTLGNPNRTVLDAPSAMLTAAVAQGLVRFDAAGQIEPALAQSWTVSDDGMSYIFRIARTEWTGGGPVTAEQVAARLRAAASRASRNRLKPLLGAIQEVVAMTDRVIEIRLKSPRPNFLQLLAQPEMAVIRNDQGTGPLVAEAAPDGALRLRPRDTDDEDEPAPGLPDLFLRGERAAMAVARFSAGLASLVTGGTAADLAIARAAAPPAAALRFDPVNGLFGLAVASRSKIVGSPEARRALSMAIDRAALVGALGVPDLDPRDTLLPVGIEEQPGPAAPAWTADPLPVRQAAARTLIAGLELEEGESLRVALPDGPGMALVFAHLRRDWRRIGVNAERVSASERPDLLLLDEVAPASLASWYLRHFTCDASRVCSPEADAALEAARGARVFAERRDALAAADRLLTETVPFIPLAAPVRWSLVAPRLTGWQPNPFAVRYLGSLIARRR